MIGFDAEVTGHLTALALVNRALRENARINCGKVCGPGADAVLVSSLNARETEMAWLAQRGMLPDVGDSVYRVAHTSPES